jgi:hypothetical protein
VRRKIPLAEGETARTACVRVLVRSGVEEKTGEFLPPAVVAQRVRWCGDLVGAMVTGLLTARWNAPDVARLASGVDAGDQPLPSNVWMALRRLGWTARPAEGLKVNDRVVRMAQEQAGRTLRSASWRADVVAGIMKTWPADPRRRTPAEWDAVRDAIDGGRDLPGSVIKGRPRQIARFLKAEGRLPADVFELEGLPRVARMLLLAACDAQQATLARDEVNPRAQATRGTLSGTAPGPPRSASGGNRHHGPATAPRSHPEPGRARHDRYQGPSPAPRSSTGRRIPPARPRHPAPMAPILSPYGSLRTPKPIRDAIHRNGR